MSGARVLYVLRRRVPGRERAGYERLWGSVSAAARAAGVNAWRFGQGADPSERLEFLEGPPGFDPRMHGDLEAAIGALDALHPPIVDDAALLHPWLEVPETA